MQEVRGQNGEVLRVVEKPKGACAGFICRFLMDKSDVSGSVKVGRPKKNLTLDEQIEAAQNKVHKYAVPYQAAVEELKELLDQRNKSREQRVLEALRDSKRSYDEIMRFIQSDPADDE